MNPLIAFVSGIVGAFTPCVVVLFPVLLYRFFHQKEKHWVTAGLFALGFIGVFMFIGYVLRTLFTSQIESGIRLALGLLFIVFGILSMMKRINPMQFPMFKNPILLGISFALALSVNPCTLPYVSVMLSLSSNIDALVNMFFLGLGLLVPAILFAFFGNRIMTFAKKGAHALHSINKLMSIVLILSGLYLISTIAYFGIFDSYIVAGVLLIIFGILLRAFFIVLHPDDLKSIKVILLLLGMLILIIGAIMHCRSYIVETQEHLQCTIDGISACAICQRCIITFSIAAVIGFVGTLFVYKERKKK